MSTIYTQRRNELKSDLKDKAFQYALVTYPANVFYFTGFNSDPHERFMALLLDVTNDREFLFVPALDKDAAALASDIQSIVPISDDQVPFEVLQQTAGNLEGTVGIEAKALSYDQYINLTKHFNTLQLTDIQPFINGKRMKKSKEEIVALKKALIIIEDVLAEGIKKIKAGMTEVEVVAELEYLMRQFGADGPSFATTVLSGENAALPHGAPGNRIIGDGDFVLIDFGVIKDGYISDITRTFAMNSVTEKQKKIYDIVLQSNEAGINAVKSGDPLKDFDIAAREVIELEGYGDFYNNRVGHGVGIEVHEEPSVHGKNEMIATEGMVFTIEPGIYIPNEVGVRIEDTVFINDQGKVEVLSSFPKQLQII